VREKRDPIEHLGQNSSHRVGERRRTQAIDKDTRQIVNTQPSFATESPEPIPPNSIRTCWHDFFAPHLRYLECHGPRMRPPRWFCTKRKISREARRRGDASILRVLRGSA